jgi:hypothetical protein
MPPTPRPPDGGNPWLATGRPTMDAFNREIAEDGLLYLAQRLVAPRGSA